MKTSLGVVQTTLLLLWIGGGTLSHTITNIEAFALSYTLSASGVNIMYSSSKKKMKRLVLHSFAFIAHYMTVLDC